MKAPNKIYVEICEDGIFAFPEPPFKESVEYIRKDALLEWAKAMKRICKTAEPIEKAYQTMIDKLNEM